MAVDERVIPLEEEDGQADEPHVAERREEVALIIEAGILGFLGEWIHTYPQYNPAVLTAQRVVLDCGIEHQKTLHLPAKENVWPTETADRL